MRRTQWFAPLTAVLRSIFKPLGQRPRCAARTLGFARGGRAWRYPQGAH